jgi:uncharacterized membrane protein
VKALFFVNEDNNKLNKSQDSIYRLAGSIALIFAVPVIIAAFVGTRLDAQYFTGRRYTLIFMAIAFVLSWALFIRKYRKIINPPSHKASEGQEQK